jgi:iron complex transport system permease protein
MKILIDIDELLEQGVVSAEQAAKLRDHAVKDTGSTAINILLALGAIAVAAGLVALTLSPGLSALLGAGFIAGGYVARNSMREMWGKLGSIWMIVGALTLSASLGYITNNPAAGSVMAAVILGGTSWVAGSRLLAALVPLALESAIGGSTGYWTACYEIVVREPTLTIVLFAALALVGWLVVQRLQGLQEALALAFTRMCIILVNFGFWIGSLWGDSPGHIWRDPESSDYESWLHPQVPALTFVVGWALALLAAGAWGAKNGRRFMVNTAATFGAIHLYTQWFERLGADPLSVMLAGVATIAIGLGLWRYNRGVLEASKPT